MNKNDIEQIIKSISTVKTTRECWFVRTQGGNYYEDFLKNKYVAIGYDEINLSDIKNASADEVGKSILTEIIRKKFPDEGRPGFISGQLVDFAYNISKGDIVIIPSYSSEYVSFGEVVETPIYTIEKKLENEECPFLKRKKIKWHKTNIPLASLDSDFITLKYSQKTITKLDSKLTAFVDRIITPIFIKDNDAHLALDVQRKEKIPAYELFNTWTNLLELTEEFGKENDLEIDKKSFDLKINVQSPGTIEFITYAVTGIVVLSVIVGALVGAEYESNTRPIRFKLKSEGLLKKITDFLNSKQDRLIKSELAKKVKDMEINPDEVAKILDKINKSDNAS